MMRMKSIIFVTSNKGKAEEAKKILKTFGIEVIWKTLEVPEIQSDSLEDISLGKANDAFEKIKKPLIMEDTGIIFNEYNNFPGPYSKYAFHSLGYTGILKLLNGSERSAQFKTVVTYIEKNKSKQFIGTCKGRITERIAEPVDEKLPYDAMFIPDGDNRCFSQMSKEEKAKYSSRADAFLKFGKFFIRFRG